MSEGETLFLCDCEGSMSLDRKKLQRAAKESTCRFGSAFCLSEAGRVREVLEAGGEVTVACGQEAPFFLELAEELGAANRLRNVDIRDRAGWSEEGSRAVPKMAALLAAAKADLPPVGSLSLESEGVCLVYGSGAASMQAAEELSDRLAVTLMLADPGDAIPPALRSFPILAGRVRSASGALGRFEIIADGVADLIPGGRGGFQFGKARDKGRSDCDLILDLSGGAPWFTGHERRDGYFHVDPVDAAALSRALFEISGFVGTFEKPLYVQFDKSLCAHSRSGQSGCTRCLDVCPAVAITPDGDTVAIDPGICAGCGACASVCPTGAASYALPGRDAYRSRIEAMLAAFESAGGKGARILLYGSESGAELLSAAARFGRGLPADVLPVELNEPTQTGHAEFLAALAAGARQVALYLPTRIRRAGEAVGLDGQVDLVRSMLAGLKQPEERILVVETDDPDALSDALYEEAPAATGWERVSPLGGRRAVTRLALGAAAANLKEEITEIPLPEGAPYGRVVLNQDRCTLCLACVGQCPTGALRDNPDRPELRFEEDACVQCGICTSTCPESALVLEPRYLLDESARRPLSLKADEPFACVSCGQPFGSRGAIERILQQLGGQHWMFPDDERARIIQMCSDCRVQVQFHQKDSPFRMGERPRVRTTEDYLEGRLTDDDVDGNGNVPPTIQ